MKLQALIKEIRASYKCWNEIAEHGCSDPCWEDGVNMNLVRNHIIFFKSQIIDKVEEKMGQIPQEVYWALPPKVPATFMVKSGKYYKRCKKWGKERLSKIILRADTDMSLF